MQPFGPVLSLGSDCVPAHQFQRFFGKQDTSCFDWLAVPMAAIHKILDTEGAHFAERMMSYHQGTTVACLEYGVLYHHDFPRGERELVQFDVKTIQATRARLQFMYRSFIESAREGRPLFVRWGGATNAYQDELARRPLRTDDLAALDRKLEEKLGHPNFHVAFVEIIGKPGDVVELSEPLPARVSHHRMNFGGFGNMGDDAAWDELLTSFGLEKRLAA